MITQRFSFRPQNRVTTTKQFSLLFSCGKRISGKWFICYWKPNTINLARLGVVVAKRSQKKAVHRNFTRRVIKESFRLTQQILVGLDIVVVVKKEITKLTPQELRQELAKQWELLRHVGKNNAFSGKELSMVGGSGFRE